MLNCSYPLPQTCCAAFRPPGGFCRVSGESPFHHAFPQADRCSTTARGYRFMEVLIDTETDSVSGEDGELSGFKVHEN
ncbi:hypothetical protein AGR9A_Cc70164 [Agrobacterium salinitolerans str. Hayward 0363]|nr:hypothetical protein AGR9A_Cc70164 [Agrobacterium salinitolerans str. Hayward 0363]